MVAAGAAELEAGGEPPGRARRPGGGRKKTAEGADHPDRDAQFRYINAQAREHLDASQPVISVDAKKKENVGKLQERRPGNGGPRAAPSGSTSTTSRTRSWAR